MYVRTQKQSVNNSATVTIELRRGVTIGSATAPMKQNGLWAVLDGDGGRGSGPATITSAATIFAAKRGIRFARNASNITGATTITNSGDISSGEEGVYLWYSRVVAPWVSAPLSTLNTFTGGATITNTGAIAVSGADKYGIVMDYRGIGAAEVDNSGAIDAPLGSGVRLLHANGDGRLTNNGAATLTNRGAVSAAAVGLRLDKRGGSGATTLANSGDVTVMADAAAGVGHAIWLTEGGSGAVTVTNSGALRSKNHALFVETSAANTAGLTLTNSGAVASEDGDGIRIDRAAGSGAVSVTVAEGGSASGGVSGVHVEGGSVADRTVTVHGSVAGGTVAGVRLVGGGTLVVGPTGRIVAGGVLADGAGALTVRVSGVVVGDVRHAGSGALTLTAPAGSVVTGTVHDPVGASTTVAGSIGRLVYTPAAGASVTVTETGRLTGVEVGGAREAIRVGGGEVEVTLHVEAGLTAPEIAGRIDGAIRSPDRSPAFHYVPAGGEPTRLAVGGETVALGAFDLGLHAEGGDMYRLRADWAPRSRVYEALPSFLLGLNAPSGFGDRSAAVRSANGAWAVVEMARGSWKAERSTTPGLKYRHRRHGATTGLDVPVGGNGLLGLSLHHRSGTAEVAGGGEIALSGRGVGLSGSWVRDGAYVDLRAETTWWDADFTSSLRGRLKREATARGRALGLETGLRIERSGASMTPRVGLVHSRVSMAAFEDATGARVSLEDGRRLGGRAGVAAEATPWALSGARLFGSLDVERELSGNAKVRVSGTRLRSDSPVTWLRLGLGGSHEWGEGRYALAGEARYATSVGGGHDLGAGLNLAVRF